MVPSRRPTPAPPSLFDLDSTAVPRAVGSGTEVGAPIEEADPPGAAAPLSDEPPTLTIAALFARVDRVLRRGLEGPVWVTGEIRSVKEAPSGHCYLDLVDPAHARDSGGPVLRIVCWSTHWRPLRRSLDRLGVHLEPGQVVRVRGEVRTYARQSALNLAITELDTEALMGRVAAARARLVAALVEEGLYEANRSLPFPDLPLRIGLVASPGTEGYHDFLGQLAASGLAFRVVVAPAVVQGATAPRAIATALARIERAGCDVAVLVRGGGSRADLAPFDAERVARAVAAAGVPVLTGIGHTGDRSVADEVAHRAFVTPTECGAHLARVALACWSDTVERATRIGQASRDLVVADGAARHRARHRLVVGARAQVTRHHDRVVHRTGSLQLATRNQVGLHRRSLATRGERLVREARTEVRRRADGNRATARRLTTAPARLMDATDTRVLQWRRLLDAFDVRRQLDRGYSITRDATGAVVRSRTHAPPGTALTTQVADGTIHSVVADHDDEGSGDG